MVLSLGLLRVKWAGQASGLVGTSFASGLATFDAPVVSAVQRPNEPTCTAASLTLLGLSFGAFDVTPSGWLGSSGVTIGGPQLGHSAPSIQDLNTAREFSLSEL
jgi:hypothetical protein